MLLLRRPAGLLRRVAPQSGRRPASSGRQSFQLSEYSCIGLDLDHTLCQYRVLPLMELAYDQCLVPYLVETHGVPADVFPRFRDKVGMCARGVVLDARTGNLLKLAPDGAVLRAVHGMRTLSTAELSAAYGSTKGPSATRSLAMSALDPPCGRLRTFRDYFDTPALLAAAAMVDAADAGRLPSTNYSFVATSVLAGLEHMYANEFSSADGGFYSRLRDDTAAVAHRCSPTVLSRLRQLRRDGAVLFLITSSAAEFARHMAQRALATDDWFDFFDVVITKARKPAFFTGRTPFLRVDGSRREAGLVAADQLRPGVVYSQGNWGDLYALLQRLTTQRRPSCVYVGDNLAYDIHPVSAYTRCHAAVVCEELEAENGVSCQDGNATTVLASEVWGPLLRDGGSETLWGAVAARAQICVPRLDYLMAE